jgi:hypothetical protein
VGRARGRCQSGATPGTTPTVWPHRRRHLLRGERRAQPWSRAAHPPRAAGSRPTSWPRASAGSDLTQRARELGAWPRRGRSLTGRRGRRRALAVP